MSIETESPNDMFDRRDNPDRADGADQGDSTQQPAHYGAEIGDLPRNTQITHRDMRPDLKSRTTTPEPAVQAVTPAPATAESVPKQTTKGTDSERPQSPSRPPASHVTFNIVAEPRSAVIPRDTRPPEHSNGRPPATTQPERADTAPRVAPQDPERQRVAPPTGRAAVGARIRLVAIHPEQSSQEKEQTGTRSVPRAPERLLADPRVRPETPQAAVVDGKSVSVMHHDQAEQSKLVASTVITRVESWLGEAAADRARGVEPEPKVLIHLNLNPSGSDYMQGSLRDGPELHVQTTGVIGLLANMPRGMQVNAIATAASIIAGDTSGRTGSSYLSILNEVSSVLDTRLQTGGWMNPLALREGLKALMDGRVATKTEPGDFRILKQDDVRAVLQATTVPENKQSAENIKALLDLMNGLVASDKNSVRKITEMTPTDADSRSINIMHVQVRGTGVELHQQTIVATCAVNEQVGLGTPPDLPHYLVVQGIQHAPRTPQVNLLKTVRDKGGVRTIVAGDITQAGDGNYFVAERYLLNPGQDPEAAARISRVLGSTNGPYVTSESPGVSSANGGALHRGSSLDFRTGEKVEHGASTSSVDRSSTDTYSYGQQIVQSNPVATGDELRELHPTHVLAVNGKTPVALYNVRVIDRPGERAYAGTFPVTPRPEPLNTSDQRGQLGANGNGRSNTTLPRGAGTSDDFKKEFEETELRAPRGVGSTPPSSGWRRENNLRMMTSAKGPLTMQTWDGVQVTGKLTLDQLLRNDYELEMYELWQGERVAGRTDKPFPESISDHGFKQWKKTQRKK